MLKVSMSKTTIVQCGVAAIASLAVLSWVRLRPLGIFFLAVFCFWFYRTQCNWRIVPPPQLQQKYEQLLQRLRDWRTTKPIMLGTYVTGSLCVLAVIGQIFSGATLALVVLLLAVIISSKYKFQVAYVERRAEPWSLIDDLDDEFIPEENATNLVLLERASDVASLTLPTEDADEEERSDDIPSELLIPDSIPEINEISTDEDDDLVPTDSQKALALTNAQSGISHNNISGNSISNVAANNKQSDDNMSFKKGHFKRDSSLSTSSSSSEESLSKGLQFPDVTAVDGPSLRQLPPIPDESITSAQTLLASSSKLLPNLVSGLVQWGMGASVAAAAAASAAAPAATAAQTQQRVVTALDSSDESDFEILDNEEFK